MKGQKHAQGPFIWLDKRPSMFKMAARTDIIHDTGASRLDASRGPTPA
jgi:hypothetical protein